MGRLRSSPIEVRIAATLFLLLLGIANVFGAWQVRNFASFTPAGTAATVAPEAHHDMTMACCRTNAAEEHPIDIAALDMPHHQVSRELLVQDTHVHVPVYAITAALLSLLVFGLDLSTAARTLLVVLAFLAPFADFAGLWGAHLAPSHGEAFGSVAVGGGYLMGFVYLVVLTLTLVQSWLPGKENPHA
jgi:hypothetical protein